jgi:hypothetical protein
MLEIQWTEKMLVLLSENDSVDWPVHQRDKVRRKFITYLAAKTKKELMAILQELEFESYTIRTAQRLKPYKYEAKICGLSWEDTLSLASNLGANFLETKIISH